MTFNNSEYNSLRIELIHHDRSCLTILQFLLTVSTAIYGLVLTKKIDSSLLILLSTILFIGFLYVVEKRATIKRISLYIKKKIEPKIHDFGWEEWSNKERNEVSETSLPKISPLIIELSLLTTANIFNFIWLCLDKNSEISQICNSLMIKLGVNNINIVFVLLFLIFAIPVFYSFYIVFQYYKYKSNF